MLKLGIVGDGNDGIAPLTGCPVPVPTSKPDQYTPVTLLLFQHRPRSSSMREASESGDAIFILFPFFRIFCPALFFSLSVSDAITTNIRPEK